MMRWITNDIQRHKTPAKDVIVVEGAWGVFMCDRIIRRPTHELMPLLLPCFRVRERDNKIRFGLIGA